MKSIELTIPSGSQESNSVRLPKDLAEGVRYILSTITIPSGMDGTAIALMSSLDGDTWHTVSDKNGDPIELKASGTTADLRVIPTDDITALEYLKLRSDSSETADRTLKVGLRKPA